MYLAKLIAAAALATVGDEVVCPTVDERVKRHLARMGEAAYRQWESRTLADVLAGSDREPEHPGHLDKPGGVG